MPEKKPGDVALWRPESDNPKAPQARGTIVAHRNIQEGETVEIALWRNRSDNPRAPVMSGKVSDKRQKNDAKSYQQASQGGAPAGDSEDMPF